MTVRNLYDAIFDYATNPTDELAREVAGLVDERAPTAFLASAFRTLARSPMVGPHDVALAACAAVNRACATVNQTVDRTPLAKCDAASSVVAGEVADEGTNR